MSEDGRDLASLFEVALAAGDQPTEYFQKLCGGDQELFERLQRLLKAHESASGFLSQMPSFLAETRVGSSERHSVGDDHNRLAGQIRAGQVSVLEAIEKSAETCLPRVSLQSSPEDGEEPILRTYSEHAPKSLGNSKYQIQGEIARGGMGAILRGRDLDLGRELAVKVLLEDHRHQPAVIQRFIEEAQIGGQLQHPGIAPVYELGQFYDQRPYFTMKLVKGKTLACLLEERESPLVDRAKLLGIFEQICQTVAYAHSRHVIHRDLKPSNIMVGAFGEVQVMDWGLAKVLVVGGTADEERAFQKQHPDRANIIETIRSSGSGQATSNDTNKTNTNTQLGSVMGTPAYMPPEQALGEIDRLDERCDVFSLGAILCEILTGKPPYVGKHHTEVFHHASQAKLDDCFDRLQHFVSDDSLREIVRDTLSPEPTLRPRDASVLAKRVSGYLESIENRARDAELAKVEADTRVVEERKRRRIAVALAASIIFAMLFGGGSFYWIKQQQNVLAANKAARQSELRDQILAELSTATALGRLDSNQLPERASLSRALGAIDRAQKLTESGEVGETLVAQLDKAHLQLSKIDREYTLIDALDRALEVEREFYAELERNRRSQLFGLAKNKPTDFSSVGTEDRANPIQHYTSAFSDWGLSRGFDMQDGEELVATLHPRHRPLVFGALDRWSLLLSKPVGIEHWQQVEWQPLEAFKLASRGQAKLELLDDQSVLASGEDAWGGYELEFDTDIRKLSALRLEALLHPSLPNGGPGRAVGGIFGIDDLRIHIAPHTNLNDRQELRITSAVADYSPAFDPIRPRSWNTDWGGGRPHTAVFAAEAPVESNSGFRICITTGDLQKNHRTSDWNLGRFRWSVTNANLIGEFHSMSKRISDLVTACDPDMWRRAMRKHIGNSDLPALFKLADSSEVEEQPSVTLIQLADYLARVDNRSIVRSINETSPWYPLKTSQIETESGTKIDIQKDGYLLTSGTNPPGETIVLKSAVDRPVSAIRFEVVPPGNVAGNDSGWGFKRQVAFQEISCELVDQHDSEARRIPLKFAVSDLPRNADFARALDGDPASRSVFWRTKDPGTLFLELTHSIEPVDEDRQELVLRIKTGRGAGKNLRRFRLSTTDDPHAFGKVVTTAPSLLYKSLENAPDDYWARVSLATTLRRQEPPDLELARVHAMAAIALRPHHPAGHVAFISSMSVNQLLESSKLQRSLADSIKRLQAIHVDHAAYLECMDELIGQARQHLSDGKEMEAREILELVEKLAFESAQMRAELSATYNKAGWNEEAMEQFERAFELKPDDPMLLNQAAWYVARSPGAQHEELDTALSRIQRASELLPDDVSIRNTMSVVHYRLGQYAATIQSLENSESYGSGIHIGYDGLFLAMAHWQLGQQDEARKWYDKAVKYITDNEPDNEELLLFQAEAKELMGVEK